MRAIARMLGMAMALTSASLAAQPYDTPPPIAAPRSAAIAPPVVRTLGNGLRVVIAQRRGLPLVTAELVVRSGTEVDPSTLAGLADLTATLLTKGTTTRNAPQIAQDAEVLGGQLDSGAGWNRSFVSITVTRPQLSAALALVADVTRNPRFATAELERARRLAIDGLNVALAQPGTLSRLAADRAAFGSGTYAHPAHGTPATLSHIKRADVAALHARLYRPDNVSLIFAGDIEPDDAVALAQTAFGGWKRPATPLPAPPLAAPSPVVRVPIAIAMTGAGQAGVTLVAPTIARSAADYYPGVVANTLLGGGYSSRLNQEVRIKRGLTYSVFSQLEARRNGGVFAVEAQTKNPAAPQVVSVMLAEIARVVAEPAPADEIEARKLAVIGSVSRRFETTDDLAGTLASLEANAIDVAELIRTIPKLAAVTPAEVQAFAKTHWPANGFHIVVAGEAPQFADALRAAYPNLVVIPQKDVDLDRPGLVRR